MITVKGERIDLVIPTRKHKEDIIRHIDDKHVAKWLDNVPHPYKEKDYDFFLKQIVQKGIRNKTDYPFAIYEKEKGEVIGCIGVHHVDKKHKHAEIGYWIARKYWRRGYATEAIKLVLRFCFRRLRLHKVYSRTFGPNKASAALLMKAGFRQEGLFRKQSFKHGRWHDEPRFGILREEYDKQN